MVDDLIEAVALAVHGALGNSVTIYDDPVEQDLRQPCVIIQQISADRVPLLGDRAYLNRPLDLVYLTKGDRRERDGVAVDLLAALRLVTTPGGERYLGTSLSARQEDGVLHVSVSYNTTVRIPSGPIASGMGELRVHTGITKEE